MTLTGCIGIKCTIHQDFGVPGTHGRLLTDGVHGEIPQETLGTTIPHLDLMEEEEPIIPLCLLVAPLAIIRDNLAVTTNLLLVQVDQEAAVGVEVPAIAAL